AVTGAPLDVTTTTATLTGTVNPFTLGGSYGFEFGPTSAYGTTTALTAFAASGTAVPVSTTIAGLSPGTTYHARLDDVTGDGSAPGADVTFTTGALPSVHVVQCVVPKLKGLSLKK